MKTRLLSVLLLLLPACDLLGEDGGNTEDAGHETGPCIEGSCFNGLECLSDLCVADEDSATEGGTPGVSTGPGQTSAATSASGSGPDSGSDDGGGSSSGDPTGSDPTGSDPTDPTGSDPTGSDPTTGGGPEQDCDPYLQDCPDGEKCNPWSNNGGSNWNDLGCFPVDPSPDQPGESCTVEDSGVSGYDSCDVGSMCWDVDTETNVGTCVAMCEGSAQSPTCADPTATCSIANDGVINLCLPGCDPLVQDCGAGEGCYPLDDGFVCAPDASGGAGLPGDGCQFINVCAPGNACIDTAAYGMACGTGCCSPLCDVTEAVDCPEVGQECTAWFAEGAAPPGLENIGVCTLP